MQPRTANQILSQRQLAAEVCRLASRPAEWASRVRLDAERRWYEQIHAADGYELWLISWLPGHAAGFHDHGGASGAFSVMWGALDEYVVPRAGGTDVPSGTDILSDPVRVRSVGPGLVRSFGPHYIHDVRNTSKDSVAVSIHAYSPPLTAMTRYDLTPGGLVAATTQTPDDW